MKKHVIIGTGLVTVIISTVFGCCILGSKEVDDVAEHGPIQSERISILDQQPLFEGILAAGISWDYDNDRFFISTDRPHRFFARKTASFYVVNAALDDILYQKDLEPDGDLEGLAYLGNNEVAIISEAGTLYYLRDNGGEWVETQRTAIFEKKGMHKLASLAYDWDHEVLYTAEKEGTKTIYQLSREGKLISTFELTINDFAAKREFEMTTDYTISGMSYSAQHLYILSEAYSTIFVYSLEREQIVRVYGVTGMHESAGIALKQGMAYIVGDFESYLPPPQFYQTNFHRE
jgi:uncharacterized protein YjiK